MRGARREGSRPAGGALGTTLRVPVAASSYGKWRIRRGSNRCGPADSWRMLRFPATDTLDRSFAVPRMGLLLEAPASHMVRALPVHTRRLVGPPRQAVPLDTARSHPDWQPGGVTLDRILLGLVLGGWGITVAWLTSGTGDAAARLAIADVGEPVLDVLAGVIVLLAALRVDVRRIRLGWAVLGIATLVYAVADGAWAWLDLGGGGTASPSLADAAYDRRPLQPRDRADRFRTRGAGCVDRHRRNTGPRSCTTGRLTALEVCLDPG